jgi:hypothetical protein
MFGLGRFLVESVLVALAVIVVRVGYDVIFIARGSNYTPWSVISNDMWTIGLTVVAVQVLSTLVFYGTSGDVTPLSIIRGLGSLVRRTQRIRVSPLEVVTATTSTTQQEADSSVVRIAGVENPVNDVMPDNLSDEVSRILWALEKSAGLLANRMERRMNTYLILGITIGAVGLAVWAYASQVPTHNPSEAAGMELLQALAFHTLPRLTILVFIEVLAGFFLRQYRIGVEDFKYFLQLKRQADTNLLGYAMVAAQEDEALKAKFFEALLAQTAGGRTDETTKVMELAENPTAKLVEALTGTVNDAVKALAAAANTAKGK